MELVDLKSYESVACISSENTPEERCADIIEIFVDSDQVIDTGVEELEGFNIAVSPNPASEYVMISIPNLENKASVIIYDALGREVMQQEIVNSTSIRMDLNGVSKGIYYISISGGKNNVSKKLIIK